ncbi:MAG: 50S ribosomal protein L24e [Methanomassiliicoccales archaeon]
MVELRVCSFCGKEMEPGTGKMYVKKDGTVYLFCTNKCSKNMIDMNRVPRTVTWTRAYAREKEVRMHAPEAGEARKVRADRKAAREAEPKYTETASGAESPESKAEATQAEAAEAAGKAVQEQAAEAEAPKAKKSKAEKK